MTVGGAVPPLGESGFRTQSNRRTSEKVGIPVSRRMRVSRLIQRCSTHGLRGGDPYPNPKRWSCEKTLIGLHSSLISVWGWTESARDGARASEKPKIHGRNRPLNIQNATDRVDRDLTAAYVRLQCNPDCPTSPRFILVFPFLFLSPREYRMRG